jgi:indolepyruvate decarboxylase
LQDTLQQIVDVSGLYFTTTSLGKTILDERQRQFIGTYAGPASPALTRAVMKATDCPIALGTIITDDYLDIMGSSFASMIEVNDQEARVGYQYYHQVTMPDFLSGLLERFQSGQGASRSFSLPSVEPEARAPVKPGTSLTYTTFYEEIAEFLKDDRLRNEIVLVLGESTSLYVFGNLFGLPRNGFVAEAAWGSLGHEMGCALGVALGSGKRPLVIAGDGGFMMICQELSSLVRQHCNAVVFVMSNKGYAIEQAFVDINAFKPNGTFAPFDVLPTWDYLALAKAFGARGYRAKTVKELRGVLAKVRNLQDAPALVEVVIPEKDLAPQLKRLAEPPPALRKYGRTPPKVKRS